MSKRLKIAIGVFTFMVPAIWILELKGLDWLDRQLNLQSLHYLLIGIGGILLCCWGIAVVWGVYKDKRKKEEGNQ